jgi:hypothetical protein
MIPGLGLDTGGGSLGGPSSAASTSGAINFGGFSFAPPAKISWVQLGIIAAIAVGAVLIFRR